MKRTFVLGLIVLGGAITAAALTAQQPAAPAGAGRGGGPQFPPVGRSRRWPATSTWCRDRAATPACC